MPCTKLSFPIPSFWEFGDYEPIKPMDESSFACACWVPVWLSIGVLNFDHLALTTLII